MDKFEKLKKKLFDAGYDAVSDFLGYDHPENEDKDVTENRMDQRYEELTDDKLGRFYAQYGIG